MLFSDPTQSPYDLNFRLGTTPVRINPTFWLFSILFGSSSLELGVEYLAIWVGVVFVSILVHELGHVWMGQIFGTQGNIVLYGAGGLAIGSNELPNRWQRMAVCFAGPLAGFVLLGGVFAFLAVVDRDRVPAFLAVAGLYLGIPPPADPFLLEELRAVLGGRLSPAPADFAITQLVFINLLWGLINLVPVWPLDGGQISRDFCGFLFPGRGLRISLGLSFGLATVLAIHSILRANGQPHIPFLPFGGVFTALLFGLLAVDSFQQLQRLQRDRSYWDNGWERDPNIWRR